MQQFGDYDQYCIQDEKDDGCSQVVQEVLGLKAYRLKVYAEWIRCWNLEYCVHDVSDFVEVEGCDLHDVLEKDSCICWHIVALPAEGHRVGILWHCPWAGPIPGHCPENRNIAMARLRPNLLH